MRPYNKSKSAGDADIKKKTTGERRYETYFTAYLTAVEVSSPIPTRLANAGKRARLTEEVISPIDEVKV